MKPRFANKQCGAFLFASTSTQEDTMLTMIGPYSEAENGTAEREAPPPIEELAERQLRGNSYRALKNLSCAFQDGALVLRGCVPTYYLKHRAQEAVARVEGVGRIE